eukprot:jgi/Botrbrau1/20728/Bobra.0058s0056.1
MRACLPLCMHVCEQLVQTLHNHGYSPQISCKDYTLTRHLHPSNFSAHSCTSPSVLVNKCSHPNFTEVQRQEMHARVKMMPPQTFFQKTCASTLHVLKQRCWCTYLSLEF